MYLAWGLLNILGLWIDVFHSTGEMLGHDLFLHGCFPLPHFLLPLLSVLEDYTDIKALAIVPQATVEIFFILLAQCVPIVLLALLFFFCTVCCVKLIQFFFNFRVFISSTMPIWFFLIIFLSYLFIIYLVCFFFFGLCKTLNIFIIVILMSLMQGILSGPSMALLLVCMNVCVS